MDLKDYEELKADAQAILTGKRSEYSVSELDVIELIEKGNKYNTDILTQVSTIREYIKQRKIELDRLPLDDISQLKSSQEYTIKLFENTETLRNEKRGCYEENICVLEEKHIEAVVKLRLSEPNLKLQQIVSETLRVLQDTKKVAKEEDESFRLKRDNLERTIQNIAAKIESFSYIANRRKELTEDITNFESQIIKVKLNINSFERMIKDRQKRLHALLSDANRAQLRVDEIQRKINEIKGKDKINE